MANQNQTAVQWLVSILNRQGFAPVLTDEEIQQANAMEKERIINAYKMGKYEHDKIVMSDTFYAEQYYNKTFNK